MLKTKAMIIVSIILSVHLNLAAISNAQLPPPPPPEPSLNDPPSSPRLLFPANNQDSLATTLTFRWEKSSDPDGDTVSYGLYACEDDSFTMGCISETGIVSRADDPVYYAGMNVNLTVLLLAAGFILITGIPAYRKKISSLISILMITAVLLISCGSKGGESGGDSAPADNGAASDGLSQTLSGLKDGTIYYWRVVATDNQGGQSGSEVRNFATQ